MPPPLYKPPANSVTGHIMAALEKQETLFPVDRDGVPVTLTSGFRCRSLTDVADAVDLILAAVLPGDLPGGMIPLARKSTLTSTYLLSG